LGDGAKEAAGNLCIIKLNFTIHNRHTKYICFTGISKTVQPVSPYRRKIFALQPSFWWPCSESIKYFQ